MVMILSLHFPLFWSANEFSSVPAYFTHVHFDLGVAACDIVFSFRHVLLARLV